MTDSLRTRADEVVAARSAGRLAGIEPEPRADLRLLPRSTGSPI